MNKKYRFKHGWAMHGKEVTVIGEQQIINGKTLLPITIEGQEYPSWAHPEALEEIKETPNDRRPH